MDRYSSKLRPISRQSKFVGKPERLAIMSIGDLVTHPLVPTIKMHTVGPVILKR